MGVRILEGNGQGDSQGGAVLYDSVSGWAFGPVFDSYEDAAAFNGWLEDDARSLTEAGLRQAYGNWKREQAAPEGEAVEALGEKVS